MEKALNEIEKLYNIPFSYVKREAKVYKCIVYTYIDYPKHSADGKETSTKYDVFINLLLENKLTETTKNVTDILKNNGFKKVIINSPKGIELDSKNLYEITMNYKVIIESEEL